MGQVSTSTQSQGSRFGHCMKTLPIRSALSSVTPPPDGLFHTAEVAVLIPFVDDAFREELNKFTHGIFSFQNIKEDTY